MAEVVNLRLARKAKARAEADAAAATNRAKHGRTKADKARVKAETGRAARELVGKKLED